MKGLALTIGEVATNAGVNVQTLRYYERRGILPEPARTESGYRAYDSETIRIIRFIKHAQALGFSLDEVVELLRLRTDGAQSCADVREAARAKVKDIEQKIESLEAMKRALDGLIRACGKKGVTQGCPLLDALDVDTIPETRRRTR